MKIQRNDPCLCGSGKKYKKCCGLADKDVVRPQTSRPQLTALSPLEIEINALIALLNTGRNVELVEAKARELTSRHPSSGLAWKLLGVSLSIRGKDALEVLQKAALLLPHDAEAHNNLGSALRLLGHLDEALASCRRAVEIKPDFAQAHSNLGHVLLDLGQYDNAVASYRRAIEIKPDFAEAHCNLGAALLRLGQPDAAVASCRRALQIKPAYAHALNNLGHALLSLNQPGEALASCRRALEIKPDLPEARGNIDAALRLLGLADEASCRKLLENNPNDILAITTLAGLCTTQGRFAEAEELFKRATSVAPDMPDAWIGIPQVRKMTSSDADWLAGAQRVAGLRLEPRKEAALHYAIAKYFDDVKDFEHAFAHYRCANELSKRYTPAYDQRDIAWSFDQIIQFHDQAWLNQTRQTAANTSARPVFVVGMPRSGTTLAEQILASHPSVFGAGELIFWGRAMKKHHSADEKLGNTLRNLTIDYLRELEDLSVDALRVVDKMPHNFQYLGLLNAALPNARIIHMKRNPVDTCLSIYFQSLNISHAYSNDLNTLASYYGEYQRLMAHWRSILPGEAFLEVPYEELVADQEVWSRKMIEFVGLPWDPRCLDFHQTSRNVLTFSTWQVRQKISKSSVARWRNYEKFVEPLLPLLNP